MVMLSQKNFNGVEKRLDKGQDTAWKWYESEKDEEIKKFKKNRPDRHQQRNE